ncbi:hypothetical protein [Bacillus kexueae]|uniref:hypothetical protein n=1 Tax=Aeribacillus kexueae TaxID=2078952 RepID=UPI001FAEA71C|nr:hypothetical protein [Bacillus kexueae]
MLSIETKKKILLGLLVILALLLSITYFGKSVPTFSFFQESGKEKLEKLPEQETVTLNDQKKYKVYYCEITEINEGTYYAKSKDGFKFSFKEDNLNEPLKQPLQVGDAIKAYFDITASVNGLVKIEIVK